VWAFLGCLKFARRTKKALRFDGRGAFAQDWGADRWVVAAWHGLRDSFVTADSFEVMEMVAAPRGEAPASQKTRLRGSNLVRSAGARIGMSTAGALEGDVASPRWVL
jgi:hypothetical protein